MIVTVNDLIKNYDDYSNIFNELDIFLKRLTSFEFTVTHRCSRACTYCYNTQHKMINKDNRFITKDIVDITFDELLKLNKVISKVSYGRNKGITVAELFGGEPLLLAFYDFKLLDYIFYLSKKNNLFVTLPVNATYGKKLSKVVIDLIEKYKDIINLSFSVDGTEIIQSYQRPINKKFFDDFNIEVPTENDTLNFIQECLNRKFNCGFHPMITPFTIKHPESLLSYIEKYVSKNDSFATLAVRNCGLFNMNSVTYEDADNFVEKYMEFYKRTKIKNWFTDLPDKLTAGMTLFNKRNYTCSIFNALYIDLDGSIDLCHRFKLNKNKEIFNLGKINIDDRQIYLDLNKICSWHRYDSKEINNCNNCFLSGMCGSSCMAEILEKYGTAQYYDESVCYANKISMYIGLKILNKIKMEGLS